LILGNFLKTSALSKVKILEFLIFVLSYLRALILLNLILLNILGNVWLILFYLTFVHLRINRFQILIFTGLWILFLIGFAQIILLRLELTAIVCLIQILNILDLRIYHLIRLARIVWIYRLLKRRNLGIFILGKSIFVWFLERSLEILVKFRVGLVTEILIIHILIVHFIVIKITCLLFLIILMWKIIKVGFGVIRVVRRRAKNILMALNRVLVILDIIHA
jgi:hypothetical protein